MRRSHALLLALAATALATSAAAAVLVVRSTGPSATAFPPGKALGDAQTITLKPNDMIILLDSRGTRTLRGPGSFSTSVSASGGSHSSLAAVTAQVGARRARVQAVRGGPAGAVPSRSPWQADVSRSGNVCVANPADLGLYRSDSGSETDLTMTDSASGKSGIVHFDAGQSVARWPAGLPVADGGSIRVKGGAEPTTLAVKLLSPTPANPEATAQFFIRNDCNAQLDVLIDSFGGNPES